MFSNALLGFSLIAAAAAHQNLHQIWINGETPGYQVGIRMPPSNSPVEDITSNDMACNVNGNKVPSGVQTIEAKAGDTIKVQWDQTGHPGPITHFLSDPVADASQATGVGSWVKIDELDYVDGKWANEIMGAKNMTHEFNLPTGIASGEYLLRSEMLALHASQTLGGGQFYIGCIQLKITGTGTGSCGPKIQIPGAYKANDANVHIPNYYNGFDATTYKAPGGDVGTCGGSGSGSGSTPVATSAAAPIASSGAGSSSTPSPVASSVSPASLTSATASPSAEAVSSVAVTPSAVAPSSVPTTLITAVASNTAAASSAAPAPTSTQAAGGDALPKEFTLSTFIAWLQAQV